jgi:DUF438 domain-containing protein
LAFSLHDQSSEANGKKGNPMTAPPLISFRRRLFQILTMDHEALLQLLAVLRRTSEVPVRRFFFRQLCTEMHAHAAAEEEKVLLPLLDAGGSTDMLAMMANNNDEIRRSLTELSQWEGEGKHWMKKFLALCRLIELHVSQDEDLLAEELQDKLSEQELAHLATEYLEMKELKRRARAFHEKGIWAA